MAVINTQIELFWYFSNTQTESYKKAQDILGQAPLDRCICIIMNDFMYICDKYKNHMN